MTFTIYALFDEREPEVVRYVGFSRDPEVRHRCHLAEARTWNPRNGRSYRLNWIRKVRADGARVLWRTLSVVNSAELAAAAEIEAIRMHMAAGHPLVNGTEGGEGIQGFGGVLAPEALDRRNASLRTDEYRAQRSEISKVRWSTEESRTQHAEKMAEYWQSEEGAVLRASNREFAVSQHLNPDYKGGARTPEARERMRQSKLGKPHAKARTAEWNEKIAAAQRGKSRRPFTEEERAARRAIMQSPEVRAKMSASAKARHAKSAKTTD